VYSGLKWSFDLFSFVLLQEKDAYLEEVGATCGHSQCQEAHSSHVVDEDVSVKNKSVE